MSEREGDEKDLSVDVDAEGTIDVSSRSLADDFMPRLVEWLEGNRIAVRGLILDGNDFTDAALGLLAPFLRKNNSIKVLSFASNHQITTLLPLVAAGPLEGLVNLGASGCTLGVDAVPPELCKNLPRLELLDFESNRSFETLVLSADALSALPLGCRVGMYESRVEVIAGTGRRVPLPTDAYEEFGDGAFVEQLCEFAGIERFTMVKAAKS
jgi:hypothetical protein